MFKKMLGNSIIVCLFIGNNVYADKGGVAGNTLLEIGENVGNMIGIAHGTKIIDDEIHFRCKKWAPEHQSEINLR